MSAHQPQRLLVEALKAHYPTATEILVSFPDQWSLVAWVERERLSLTTGAVWQHPLYIAALPPSQERPRRDHFHGLPDDLNLQLATYRLYKFFEPWPQHTITASWDPRTASGQAQAWYGDTSAVLWECYFHHSEHSQAWQDDLTTCWAAVERDLAAAEFFTQPHEPTWETGYPQFLERLGYAPHPAYPGWWSANRSSSHGDAP